MAKLRNKARTRGQRSRKLFGDDVTSIGRVSLRRFDTLVVMCEKTLSREQIERITSDIKRLHDRVLLLHGGVTMGVLAGEDIRIQGPASS